LRARSHVGQEDVGHVLAVVALFETETREGVAVGREHFTVGALDAEPLALVQERCDGGIDARDEHLLALVHQLLETLAEVVESVNVAKVEVAHGYHDRVHVREELQSLLVTHAVDVRQLPCDAVLIPST
jgi:hypothetical protein